jgi:hypothetical protein
VVTPSTTGSSSFTIMLSIMRTESASLATVPVYVCMYECKAFP